MTRKKMFFKNSFLLIFHGLEQFQKLVIRSLMTEFSEMTLNSRLTMVTRGGVRSWSMNFLD